MKSIILSFVSIFLFSWGIGDGTLLAAQLNPCITGTFSSTGDAYWKTITLKITNTCNSDVDLQDATITFQNKFDLETSFWGQFSPLAYPDNQKKISSQPDGNGTYLSTLQLHFPNYPGASSKLPAGQSISIEYGAVSNAFVTGSVKVYAGDSVATGSIIITNASAKPANVTQSYALIHIKSNGQIVTDVQLPWQSNKAIPGLTPATYTLSADNVSDSSGNIYQGVVNPTTINLVPDQNAPVTVSYAKAQQTGKLAIQLQALPNELAGYTGKPVVAVSGGGNSISVNLNWNATSTVTQLINGTAYNFSTPSVTYNNVEWVPVFTPVTLTANTMTVPQTILTYQRADGTPVSLNGQLKVVGTQLCNENNQPIQLRGMSTHGLQWYANCLTTASLDALAKDFKASVIRIALYVQEGGYETDPEGFTNKVNQLIKEASDRGMYAIVDWHILTPGDPNYNFDRARIFFTNIANANKGRKNLLYEIANEPNGVSWATIKSYADRLIPIIRAIDPNTVILVGTPGWSSLGLADGRSSQDIINAPVNFPNVMYTFHFYSAFHKDDYLNELDRASNVLPIFVTEFGTQNYTGDGANDFTMADRYMELMARKKIGWTNWNFSSDFRSGAIWKTGTCPSGPWVDEDLKPAGLYIKDKIRG